MALVRFKFHPEKALSAIQWMLQQSGPLDLHTLLKACYFADKGHLNEHLKPVFGATYRAMRFGPVPLEIYEMAKSESLWLSELGIEQMPWELRGYRLYPNGTNDPDLSALAESNMEHIAAGLEVSRRLSFNQRTAATHGPDWQKAELGIMRYEDMIEDRPDKDDVIEFLKDTAKYTKL